MTTKPVLIMCLLAFTMCGCEGGESNIIVAKYEPDPRFVTADAMVEYYNELMTADPADERRASELFYAENDKQEQFIVFNSDCVSVMEVHQALFDRFGKGYFPDKKSLFRPNSPAGITERSPQRATATFRDSDGDAQTIKLVQVDDRWWLSGSTIQDRFAHLSDERRQEAMLVMAGIGSASPELIRRLDSGEFQTFEQAHRALWTRAMQLEPELLAKSKGGR